MDDLLVAKAILGRDAEEFLNSELGRYLAGCAEQEAQRAYELIKDANPTDADEIRKLQNRIWRAESFITWIKELIGSGRQALQALDSDED